MYVRFEDVSVMLKVFAAQPKLAWKEHHAHDALVNFMRDQPGDLPSDVHVVC